MLKITNLSKAFENKVLFKDFSLDIENGDCVAFTGASGCGKTTLLNMIGAIEPIDSGEILFDDIDITKRKNHLNYFKTKVGFLFQNFALVDNKTVRENLEFIKNDCKSDISIEQALEKVMLADKIDTAVFKLSGGEQQRIALARLMIKKCDLILADEPTGSLDKGNAAIVMGILLELNKAGKTVIIVTHDMTIAQQCNKIINISDITANQQNDNANNSTENVNEQ